jgi:cyclic pyranopterin phosphate synthase
MASKLSHIREDGSVQMVDVSGKTVTSRLATVRGLLRITPEHRSALASLPKGDAITIAQIAGIQGGKKCAELIPLCHPIALTKLDVDIQVVEEGLQIEATAKTDATTGVEMEAYSAVVTAGITLIDMLKGVSPDLTLTDVCLIRKTGGKTEWNRESPSSP